MKNNVFSLLAVVIFGSCLISATNYNNLLLDEQACAGGAFLLQESLEKDGYSKEFSNAQANTYFEKCLDW